MSPMRILTSILLLWLWNTNVIANAGYAEAMAQWDNVLKQYVDDEGRIDFTALANNRDSLDAYVAFVNKTSPDNHPELFPGAKDVLAYHINTYNALAIHGILERGIPENFSSFFKRASFFKFHKVVIEGKTTSLYDYENKVIRPLGEERVHFALNCMVRGCPRLPREPFQAEKLDQQLEAVTKEFFSKEKHIHLDRDKKVLWLSEILDFYTEDFVESSKAKDLLAYVNRYLTEPVPAGYRVRFIKYDWTINRQLND